jgi:ferrochelatase
MPIGFATENHETLLDVDHIIHELQDKHSDITYVQMPCVNDRPEFLHMAADWADTQIEALLSEESVSVNPSLANPGAHHHHHHH